MNSFSFTADPIEIDVFLFSSRQMTKYRFKGSPAIINEHRMAATAERYSCVIIISKLIPFQLIHNSFSNEEKRKAIIGGKKSIVRIWFIVEILDSPFKGFSRFRLALFIF